MKNEKGEVAVVVVVGDADHMPIICRGKKQIVVNMFSVLFFCFLFVEKVVVGCYSVVVSSVFISISSALICSHLIIVSLGKK